MSEVLDAIIALLDLGLIVMGGRGLWLRRVIGPARRKTANWKQQGLGQLALGTVLLSIYGPGVFDVHGWTRGWFGFVGVLIALGLLAVVLWHDYCAWDDARRSSNRG